MIEQKPFTIPYGRNTFCGPASLAYLTRSDPDSAAKAIRAITGQRKVTSVMPPVMLAALARFGFRHYPLSPSYTWIETKLTLKAWLADYGADRNPTEEFLIHITGHYITLHGSLIFDNHFHLGRDVERCPYLRRRVIKAWKIVKNNA